MSSSKREIEWRRRWKPNLQSRSWNRITIEGGTFLMKYIFRDSSYEILITDLTNLWQETLSDAEIIDRSKTLNPSVDAPIGRLLNQVETGLTSTDVKRDVTLQNSDKVLILTIESQLAGFPFTWKFNAAKTEHSMMVNHMTIPLLSMVGELMRRQKDLYNQLTAKDREINDYKSQGVRPTRKNCLTAQFDSTTFDSRMFSSKEFETEVAALGANTFQNDDGKKLYTQIMTKHAYLVSSEPGNTTEDESLFGEISDVVPETLGGPSWGNNRLPASVVNRPSPNTSPQKTPQKSTETDETQTKAKELLRRQELNRKLDMEEAKKEEKSRKKRKLKI